MASDILPVGCGGTSDAQGPDCRHHAASHHLYATVRSIMEMECTCRLGAMAGVMHAPESTEKLLKLPPQGEGFNPPNGRQ